MKEVDTEEIIELEPNTEGVYEEKRRVRQPRIDTTPPKRKNKTKNIQQDFYKNPVDTFIETVVTRIGNKILDNIVKGI